MLTTYLSSEAVLSMSWICLKYPSTKSILYKKFSITKSLREITFLDMRVIKNAHKLQTTLFSKPTDRNNVLRPDSYHTPQTFGGILKGEFMQAKKNMLGE